MLRLSVPQLGILPPPPAAADGDAQLYLRQGQAGVGDAAHSLQIHHIGAVGSVEVGAKPGDKDDLRPAAGGAQAAGLLHAEDAGHLHVQQ